MAVGKGHHPRWALCWRSVAHKCVRAMVVKHVANMLLCLLLLCLCAQQCPAGTIGWVQQLKDAVRNDTR